MPRSKWPQKRLPNASLSPGEHRRWFPALQSHVDCTWLPTFSRNTLFVPWHSTEEKIRVTSVNCRISYLVLSDYDSAMFRYEPAGRAIRMRKTCHDLIVQQTNVIIGGHETAKNATGNSVHLYVHVQFTKASQLARFWMQSCTSVFLKLFFLFGTAKPLSKIILYSLIKNNIN